MRTYKVFQVIGISSKGYRTRNICVIKHTQPLPDNAMYPMVLTSNMKDVVSKYKKLL